jgi:hypothetical protein
MWHPALYGDIDDMIMAAEVQMEPAVKAFWDKISIVPQKWQLPPWGDEGGGFWVVAIVGQWCLYYNDIEEGFNGSEFAQFGQIGCYYCNQGDLLSFVRAYHRDFTEAIASAV